MDLKTALESALMDAGKAHHTLVENMKKVHAAVDLIEWENENWPAFYSGFLENRLREQFSISTWPVSQPRLVSPEDEHSPVYPPMYPLWETTPSVAHVYGHMENSHPVSESSKLHVG